MSRSSTTKHALGPYHIRLSRVGLHRWIELQIPKYTVTLQVLRRA